MKRLVEKAARIAFAVMLTSGLMPAAAFADEAGDPIDEACEALVDETAEADEAAELETDSATVIYSYDLGTEGWTQFGSSECLLEKDTLTIRPLYGTGYGPMGTGATAPWKTDAMKSSAQNIKKIIIKKGVWLNSNSDGLFEGLTNLREIEISELVVDYATSTSNMFRNCSSLMSLDLSKFNTSKITNMSGMFSGCKSLKSLDLSSFDTAAVTNMSGMFESCEKLSTIDITGFDTAAVTNMSGMFSGCTSLVTLRLPNDFVGEACENVSRLCAECSSLAEVPENFTFGPNGSKINTTNAFYRTGSDKLSTYYGGSDKNVTGYAWAADHRKYQRLDPTPSQVARLAGGNRYDTMSTLVNSAFQNGSAETVVVACGSNFPDALSASALAGTLNAPIALTDGKALSSQARDVIAHVGAKNIVIVGGSVAVSDSVKAELDAIAASKGGKCERVKGDDRFGTAIEVGKRAKANGAGSTAIVANGDGFADSLSIAPYAYAKKTPLYLTDKNGNLGSATVSAIRAGGYTRVIIVGGASAVSAGAEKTLKSIAGTVERKGGGNRYETSNMIAKMALKEGMACNGMVFASGKNFPDALAAGPVAGRQNAVMLLVDESDAAAKAITDVVGANKASIVKMSVAGGRAAVPQSVAVKIGSALK